MYILDTNVVSEIFRPEPSPKVEQWLEVASPRTLFVTAIGKAESLLGLASMPDGKRKQILSSIMGVFFERQLVTPILAFGDQEAKHFAELVAHRRQIGLPIGEFDAQIAAIARSHRFAVVTRDVREFVHCGIAVINPWDVDA